jgi:hypothetical protein
MSKIVLTLVLTIGLVGLAGLANAQAQDQSQPRSLQTYQLGDQSNTIGPNVQQDAVGRPYRWRSINQPNSQVQGEVQRDAYGMGVGMDAAGRPVRAVTD